MGFNTFTYTATIANGESVSGIIHLQAQRLFALQMPAAWTTGKLTFQGSYDGNTFYNVYDEDGNELEVEAAAQRFIILDPAKFIGLQRLKIRSGTSGVAVNQGAARDIQVIVIS